MLCLATTYPKPATEAERDFNIAQFGVKKKPQGYSSDIFIACAVLHKITLRLRLSRMLQEEQWDDIEPFRNPWMEGDLYM